VKVSVDQDLCISCGLCIDVAPEVFQWNDDGKAFAKIDGPLPKGLEGSAKESVEGCPTEAIKKED
jgi:ferredoxin